MKDKVRIGIVGSKFAADFHADSYRRHPRAELVAVAAIDNLEPFAGKWGIPNSYSDYREMLAKEKPDLVSVCLPNFLHAEVTIAAAEAGCHVLCEKPMATTAGDARRMREVCRQQGVRLFYGEDWCFSPSLRRALEIVREGGIGRPLYLKAKECHNGTHSPFAKDRKTCGGGSLVHLGIHPVGWALHLLGERGANRVVEVTGLCNGALEDNLVHHDNSGEDFGLGIMRFANGEICLVEGNYITVGGMDDKVEIYGTEGVIKADLTFGSPLSVYSRPGYQYCIEKADMTTGWTRPAVDEFLNLGYVDELASAVNCTLEGRDPEYCAGADLGVACIEIIEAMYQSNEEGRAVKGSWG